MKNLKKNQVVIYVIALMLVVAGYLNYTGNTQESIETASIVSNNESIQDEELGDAKLVNNNDVISDNTTKDVKEEIEDKTVQTEQSNTVEEDTKETVSNENANYFENSKLERNQMYSQMLETYEGMVENVNISETQKAIATEEITKINNTKNAIMICENLILTKGFSQNVIFVNGDSVNVVVGAEELKEDEIAQIQNIISREMKVEIENIHIMNK